MKNTIFFFIAIFGIIIHSIAQQVQLKGVVTVQNSKTNTGQIQYVKNAEIVHANDNNAKTKDVTGDDGKFILNIKGVKPNTQTQITVIPCGEYTDYVVVNKKELQDITLGRLTPVNVYICKKGELEQRQAEMIGINMKKLEECLEKEKKRLQNELEELKFKNDYLNIRYNQIKDSLDIINKNIDNAFERIKEYAQTMTLENLDDRDENYVNAYNCFSRGEFDSVFYYLSELELNLKYKKIVQLQEEIQKEKKIAEMLTESVKAKEEYSENSLNELIREWLLLARTYGMKNDYEKTMMYYEKITNVDTTNVDNVFEYANYLFAIKEYTYAEKQYLQCLKIHKKLAAENPNLYLPDVAKTLNNLAIVHKTLNKYQVALAEYEEVLKIRRKLAEENPKMYLPDVASTLNNLANLHGDIGEYQEALKEYEETLKIYRKFAEENPQTYLPHVAVVLNNLASLHEEINEYQKALDKYKESLKIYRKFAEENPKVHLPYLAITLSNLARLHYTVKEYSKALEGYEEALKIHRKLANENAKAFLPDLAIALNNISTMHASVNEYPKALEGFEEALEIYRNLVIENSKAYFPDMAMTLNNLATLHKIINEPAKALLNHKEALEIYRTLAAENPKMYLHNEIITLKCLSHTYSLLKDYPAAIKHTNECNDLLLKYQNKSVTVQNYENLSRYYLFTKEYAKSEQSAREALQLDSTSFIAKTNLAHTLLLQNRFSEAEAIYVKISNIQTILNDFNELENADIISEERKNDIEKIKKMLKERE